MLVSTSVLRRSSPRFNMVGQRLPNSLTDTTEAIPPGVSDRLRRYSLRRLQDAGFIVNEWDCEVYTMDADLPKSERVYCVEFVNAKGGRLGLQGIYMSKGYPFLDHGLTIADAPTV